MKEQLTISETDAGSRLDKFLTQNFKDFSRNYLQTAIKEGQVLVNKKKVTPHHFLKINDVVDISVTKPDGPKVTPSPSIKIDVIEETDDYIIINKPDGLIVHPAPGVKELTLVDGLAARWPQILELGDDKTRPAIVHRLDRDVSGIMVIPKTAQMFNHLKQQFKDRTTDKEYICLVQEPVSAPSGIIDFPLTRSKTQPGKMAAIPKGDEGIEAITEYTVDKNFSHASLLKVKIKTGRTHQIRAHLAAFGHPLVGEKIYKPSKSKLTKKLDRLFLHAYSLGFKDLQGNKKSYISPLPKVLADYLTTLS